MVGPYAAWLDVQRSVDELQKVVAEFTRSMNWQPQTAAQEPPRRGPGRPRKTPGEVFVHPGLEDEPRIVQSVGELAVDEDDPELFEEPPAPEPAKRRGRRKGSNGAEA